MKDISFSSLIKNICPDSKVAKSLSCAATKCTQISKHVARHYNHEVIEKLRDLPFCLMIDESNTKQDKVLAVLARYYDVDIKKASTVFVTLLECLNGTAENIFNILDSFFR